MSSRLLRDTDTGGSPGTLYTIHLFGQPMYVSLGSRLLIYRPVSSPSTFDCYRPSWPAPVLGGSSSRSPWCWLMWGVVLLRPLLGQAQVVALLWLPLLLFLTRSGMLAWVYADIKFRRYLSLRYAWLPSWSFWWWGILRSTYSLCSSIHS